ncbi:MAG: hypothetical protein GWO04_06425, partial [Actinobacteria bacterium]|nr:hypothetical protein [Actinomycetota bacterium]
VSEPIDIAEGQVPGNVIPRAVLPGGTRALCNLVEFREGSWLNHVALLDLETGDASVLMEDGALPVYANTGHILFTRYDRLLAVPFDPDRLELTGGPVAITDGLRTDDTYSGAWFKFSADGTLIHRPGGITGGNRRLVYVHPDGELEDWSDERREITEGPQVSPDGRLAAVTGIGAGALDEVLVASTGQRQLRRLVAESGKDCDPALFAPDGQRIVYRCSDSSRYWIYIRRVDGSGGAELLLEDPIDKGWAVPRRFSADGSRVLFRMSDGMYWVELEPGADGQRDRELFLADTSGWLSPDGRWFAYHSSASGRFELYLRQVSEDGDVGPEVPLTSVGLDDYVWSPTVSNGTVELFVETDDGSMQSVRIAPDASPG